MFGLDFIVSIVSLIINVILLIVFFVMGSNIGRIKTVLNTWAKQNGYGEFYNCSNCKKSFEGHPDKCPHCEELTSWGKNKIVNK